MVKCLERKLMQWVKKHFDLPDYSIKRIEPIVTMFFIALRFAIAIFVIGVISYRLLWWQDNRGDFPWTLLVVLMTAFFVFLLWLVRIVHKEVDIHNEKNRIVIEAKAKNRELFVRGVELLASEDIAVKIGGIYALADVYHRESDLERPIVELLTEYLRQKKKISQDAYQDPREDDRPREDFQQAVNVLGRLKDRAEKKYPLNFWRVDFRRMYFESHPNADFSGANFTNAWIGECDFSGVRLTGARFVHVTFRSGTKFDKETDLEGADFRGADLSEVIGLETAKLKGAKYWKPVDSTILTDKQKKHITTFPADIEKDERYSKLEMIIDDPEVHDPYRPELYSSDK